MEFEALDIAGRIERCREFSSPYQITDGRDFRLSHIDPGDTGDLKSEDKSIPRRPKSSAAA